ncbi:unnamed protein product [Amoebophrya sp. A120]|nr:unnamed protein product [Amoebophrya sp. A120]|eukprot:GSA120T00002920001.1
MQDFLQEKIASLQLSPGNDEHRTRPRSRSLAAFQNYCTAKIQEVVHTVDERNLMTKRLMTSPSKNGKKRVSEEQMRLFTMQLSRPRNTLIPRSASPGKRHRRRFAKSDLEGPIPVGMSQTVGGHNFFGGVFNEDSIYGLGLDDGLEDGDENLHDESLFRCTARTATSVDVLPRAKNAPEDLSPGGRRTLGLVKKNLDGGHESVPDSQEQLQAGTTEVDGGELFAGTSTLLNFQNGGSSSSTSGNNQEKTQKEIERMGFLHDMFMGGKTLVRDFQLDEAKRLRREKRQKEIEQARKNRQVPNPWEQLRKERERGPGDLLFGNDDGASTGTGTANSVNGSSASTNYIYMHGLPRNRKELVEKKSLVGATRAFKPDLQLAKKRRERATNKGKLDDLASVLQPG